MVSGRPGNSDEAIRGSGGNPSTQASRCGSGLSAPAGPPAGRRDSRPQASSRPRADSITPASSLPAGARGQGPGHFPRQGKNAGTVGEHAVERAEPLVRVRGDRRRQDDCLGRRKAGARDDLRKGAGAVEASDVGQALPAVVDAQPPPAGAAPPFLQPHLDQGVEHLQCGTKLGDGVRAVVMAGTARSGAATRAA